jgi:hypothetical protein
MSYSGEISNFSVQKFRNSLIRISNSIYAKKPSKGTWLPLYFDSGMSPKGSCVRGLVPHLGCWEVMETLRGGAWWEVLGHQGVLLRKIVGPWSLLLCFPSSSGPWGKAGTPCRDVLPYHRPKSNCAYWPWIKPSKTESQNKPFIIW